MKWNKIGHIFCPSDFKRDGNCYQYAQSPQALVFDDFVRVYFSTRKKDNGKYLSIIKFVDYDKKFTKILNTSDKEVISLGKKGAFDEHGIFPINIFRHNSEIFAYTTGWTRRESVSVDTGIGVAQSSDDGETFRKLGDGPILTSSLNEPFLVCDGFVKYFSNKYHMYYIYGTNWKVYVKDGQPERTYLIAHATSDDGIHWKKEGRPIIETAYNDECQALPTVIKIDERYHMYFCHRRSYDFRKNPKMGYRIGYAYSDDNINWTRNDDLCGIETTKNSWDSNMMCYPHIFACDEEIYLLYNGNEFGKNGFGIARLESIN